MDACKYAQTGIELLKLSEICAADSNLSRLLSDTASTLFDRASSLSRRTQPAPPEPCCVTEEAAAAVEMPPLEEVNGGEWRTLLIPELPTAPAPAQSVAPSRVSTVGSGPNKFQEWVRELNLPTGARFAILKSGRPEKEFRLSYTKTGKAVLTTSFADGTVIQGSSPSAVYRAFIKKATGKDCGPVDAWKKIYLMAPAGGGWQPISNPNWLRLELDWSQ
jgi:hypothetical protein